MAVTVAWDEDLTQTGGTTFSQAISHTPAAGDKIFVFVARPSGGGTNSQDACTNITTPRTIGGKTLSLPAAGIADCVAADIAGVAVFYRDCDGTEGAAPTISVTGDGASTANWTCWVVCLNGAATGVAHRSRSNATTGSAAGSITSEALRAYSTSTWATVAFVSESSSQNGSWTAGYTENYALAAGRGAYKVGSGTTAGGDTITFTLNANTRRMAMAFVQVEEAATAQSSAIPVSSVATSGVALLAVPSTVVDDTDHGRVALVGVAPSATLGAVVTYAAVSSVHLTGIAVGTYIDPNATSTPTITAGTTSTATLTAGTTSTPTLTAPATSTATLTAPATSTATQTGPATSTPTVSDG